MLKKLFTRWLDYLEAPAKRQRDQLAFLPAALEVQETPPSPIGRAIVWSIIVLFVIAVLWAGFGKIDIVAVATGKIIPSSRVKLIQPLEKGSVLAIHVNEDEQVSKGDPLITLDSTQTGADEARLVEELSTSQKEWLRAEAFQMMLEGEGSMDALTAIKAVKHQLLLPIPEQELVFQSRLLQAQLSEYTSRIESLASQKRARIGERRNAKSLADKFERTLPIISERAASIKSLYAKGMVAREQFLTIEEERINQQQELLSEQGRVEELTGEIEAVADQIATTVSEYQRNNLMAMMEGRQKTKSLEQEWIKARQRNSQQILYSPIDGTVQQLAVHTIGGVVTPAQELMQIVPRDSKLEVEAFIQNKDIGFVTEGQLAEVKIDTFNFTKYGTIDGELKTISSDAVSDEKLGLVYPARVLLDVEKIKIADKWVNLSPGMAVTVEVKTGKRRIIEFFLSPLLRYKQESIRER